ncbi:MAG: dihydroneopterin aldolase [Verrucomicrobiota bacterium]
MKASVRLNDIEVMAYIGVPDEERAVAQLLKVSVDFDLPSSAASPSEDDIECTVDYAKVRETVIDVVQTKPRKLLETLASEIMTSLKSQFQLERIDLEIEKFPLPNTRSVTYRLHSS